MNNIIYSSPITSRSIAKVDSMTLSLLCCISIPVILILSIISYDIYILHNNSNAYNDSNCGYVYEQAIISVLIHIISLLYTYLFVYNKSDMAQNITKYILLVLYIFGYIFISIDMFYKFDDTCKTYYKLNYHSLYIYYYLIYVTYNLVLLGLVIFLLYKIYMKYKS